MARQAPEVAVTQFDHIGVQHLAGDQGAARHRVFGTDRNRGLQVTGSRPGATHADCHASGQTRLGMWQERLWIRAGRQLGRNGVHHHADLSAGAGGFTGKQFAHPDFHKLLLGRLGDGVVPQQGDQERQQSTRPGAEQVGQGAAVRRHCDGPGGGGAAILELQVCWQG
ncbi:hypothetical protein D9M71_572410 [compost metagenome]